MNITILNGNPNPSNVPRTLVKTMFCITLSIMGFLSVAPGLAETRSVPEPTQRSSSTAPGPTDAVELEVFLDEIMAKQMESYHIPGVVISVVKDGKLFFAKGYGYANLEKHIPFNPETSLVRIASVTKLFTWTAVMQLVEQGKLDLNADVNTYLTTFRIPDTYPEPVTLLHLMAHAAGFESRNFGSDARTKQDVPPLGEYLAQHMPERVRPPGRISAYSPDYGASLAGYIVARFSGMPYEQYIQENILDPLDMAHTTAWEPVPDHLLADQAVSYQYVDGVYKPVPFTYVVAAPSASISASATDMAHFLIAHLQNGIYGNSRILQAGTAQLMHSQSFTHHPQLPGWAHGFEELKINGQHALSHEGGWEGFRSFLMLLPEHNLGLFVCYNGLENGFIAREETTRDFFDRYFPTSDSPASQPPAHLDQPAQRFTGWYKPTESMKTTIEKLATLVTSSRMIALDDDTLEFDGRKWMAVEPLLYREVDGEDLMAFLPNEQGEIAYAAIGAEAFERVPWYETGDFSLALLVGFIKLSLSVLIGWPIGLIIKRRKKECREALSLAPRAARWVAVLGIGLGLAFITVLALELTGDGADFFNSIVPLGIRLLMVIPIVIAVLAVATIVMTVLAWKNKYWSFWGRVHYTTVVPAMLGFFWFTNTWNLLGFHFG